MTEFEKLVKSIADFKKVQGHFRDLINALDARVAQQVGVVFDQTSQRENSIDLTFLNQKYRLLLSRKMIDDKLTGHVSLHEVKSGGGVEPGGRQMSIDVLGNLYLSLDENGISYRDDADLQRVIVHLFAAPS